MCKIFLHIIPQKWNKVLIIYNDNDLYILKYECIDPPKILICLDDYAWTDCCFSVSSIFQSFIFWHCKFQNVFYLPNADFWFIKWLLLLTNQNILIISNSRRWTTAMYIIIGFHFTTRREKAQTKEKFLILLSEVYFISKI